MVNLYIRGQREKPANIERSARCLIVEMEIRMHTSTKWFLLDGINCVALDCIHKT